MDIGNICNIQLVNVAKRNLAVTAKAESVVPLPGGQLGGVVVAAAFSKTTVLFSNTGKTASFPALVHRFGDPVDPRVAANLSESHQHLWDLGAFENLQPCDWGRQV